MTLAPFALGYAGTVAAWKDGSVGLLIAVTSGWAALIQTRRVVTLSSIAGVAAALAALAPFSFMHGAVGVRGWNDLVAGLLVMVLSTARALGIASASARGSSPKR